MIIENAINIYTDGSSFSRPRLGGIGIRLVIINSLGQEEVEDISLAGYAAATNNQMELYASSQRQVRNASKVAGEEGFEPSLADPESAVLPLDYSPVH